MEAKGRRQSVVTDFLRANKTSDKLDEAMRGLYSCTIHIFECKCSLLYCR